MTVNVAEIVREQARLRPASPAIITHEQIITYGQLNVAVGVVARHLRQRGVTPGEIVGVSIAQNALHIITILALAQIGAVSLPLHVAVPAERRILAANRFGARYVVSGRDDMALLGLIFVSLANLPFDGSSLAPDMEMHSVKADSPFRIAISSGTSGDPKGMMLTHGLMTLRSRRYEPGFVPLSRMVPMDMAFISGFGAALRTFATGAALVIPVSTQSAHLLHSIVSHGVTHILLSPSQAAALADQLAQDDPYCPSIKNMRIVGGALLPDLLSMLRKKITPNVSAGYGSTEAGAIASATPEILDNQPACVGKVNSWVQVEIVDSQGSVVPHGTIGEIRIRSTHQVLSYHLDVERTRKHFRDGWFYPGDLGGYDESGLLYIEGRVDDQLNIGGLKINPEDIDGTLVAHVDVIEAGTFALIQEERSEILAAALVVRASGNIDSIKAYATTKLGPLAPAKYFIVPSLPRTITGKLRRTELTAQFSSAPAI